MPWWHRIFPLAYPNFMKFATPIDWLATFHMQYCGVITRSNFSKVLTKDTHTSPVEGALFGRESHWYSASVSTRVCAISRHIGPRCNGTRLYMCMFVHVCVYMWEFVSLNYTRLNDRTFLCGRFVNYLFSCSLCACAFHVFIFLFSNLSKLTL